MLQLAWGKKDRQRIPSCTSFGLEHQMIIASWWTAPIQGTGRPTRTACGRYHGRGCELKISVHALLLLYHLQGLQLSVVPQRHNFTHGFKNDSIALLNAI